LGNVYQRSVRLLSLTFERKYTHNNFSSNFLCTLLRFCLRLYILRRNCVIAQKFFCYCLVDSSIDKNFFSFACLIFIILCLFLPSEDNHHHRTAKTTIKNKKDREYSRNDDGYDSSSIRSFFRHNGYQIAINSSKTSSVQKTYSRLSPMANYQLHCHRTGTTNNRGSYDTFWRGTFRMQRIMILNI
jgi:hypothetical protein